MVRTGMKRAFFRHFSDMNDAKLRMKRAPVIAYWAKINQKMGMHPPMTEMPEIRLNAGVCI